MNSIQTVRFLNYTINSVSINTPITIQDFEETIYSLLQINRFEEEIDIKYKVEDDYPAFIIDNNINLQCYIDLKRNINNFLKYPICISRKKRFQLAEMNDIPMENSALIQYNVSVQNVDCSYESECIQRCPIPYLGNLVEAATEIAKKTTDDIEMISNNTDHNRFHEASTFKGFEDMPQLILGDRFENKQVMKYYLGHYCLVNNFSYKVVKSNSTAYKIICLDKGCKWMMRLRSFKKTDVFKLRKFEPNHTCGIRYRFQEHKQLSTKFIATMVESKLKNATTNYTPLNITQEVHDKYSVKIKYLHAWRSKEKARNEIFGNPATSYNDVPTYLYQLQKANPGTYTRIKTMPDRSFLYAFFAIHGCIRGCQHCRPQVVVDGAHLKETYGGTLLTACCYNAAGKILPLAYAVVDSENNKSWEWFFESFRNAFGYRRGMCIISDRCESIRTTSRIVYPEVGHYFCIFHILSNLRKYFPRKGEDLMTHFFGAAKAYTIEKHNYYISQLDTLDKGIVPWMDKELKREDWVALIGKENRRHALTTNIAESCNSKNLLAREMPVTAFLEQLRAMIQHWSHTNKTLAMQTITPLTEKYEEQLRKNMIESKVYEISPVSDTSYSVILKKEVLRSQLAISYMRL